MKYNLIILSFITIPIFFSQIKVPKVGDGRIKDQFDAGKKLVGKKLSENDLGTLDFVGISGSTSNYEVANGKLDAIFKFPYTIKEYEMKFGNVPDYSNGNVILKAYINGVKVASYTINLGGTDYTSKEFTLTIFPESDKDLNDAASKAHNHSLYDHSNYQNSVMLQFLAHIYDKLPVGSHKLDLELWLTIEDKSGNMPPIAKNSFTFNITNENRTKLATWSSYVIPKHLNEYQKSDKEMLPKLKNDWESQGVNIYDFIRNSEFQYQTDSWGNFVSRTYTADILIKSDNVCFIAQNIKYIQMHTGGNVYGSEKRHEGELKLSVDSASKKYLPIPCKRIAK